MLFKSTILGQASGSLAGLTASRNKGGAYLRQRALPTNPNTPSQQDVRALFAQLAVSWTSVLTAVQRDAWANYALNSPIINRVGDAKPIPALAMYVRCNVPRLQAGLPRVDDAPTTFGLADFTPPTITSITAATGVMIVAFTAGDEWTTAADGGLLVLASRAQGVGINYFKGPYQFAGLVEGAATPPTSPQNITLPFAVAVGQFTFLQFRVTLPDGRLSYPIKFRGPAAV